VGLGRGDRCRVITDSADVDGAAWQELGVLSHVLLMLPVRCSVAKGAAMLPLMPASERASKGMDESTDATLADERAFEAHE